MTDPFNPAPQDPYAPRPPEPPTNPYAQPPAAPPPVSGPPTTPYGQVPYPQPGYPQPGYGQPGQPGYPVAAPQNSMALVSLILAVCGLITWVTAPIGAILGHVALKQIRETGESGEGMAKAGIIVGWIITGVPLLICCGVIAIGALASGT